MRPPFLENPPRPPPLFENAPPLFGNPPFHPFQQNPPFNNVNNDAESQGDNENIDEPPNIINLANSKEG